MKNFDRIYVGGLYKNRLGDEYVIMPEHLQKGHTKGSEYVGYQPEHMHASYPRWIPVCLDGRYDYGHGHYNEASSLFDLIERVGHYNFSTNQKLYSDSKEYDEKINIRVVETEREFTTTNFRGRITNRRGKTYVNFDRNDQFDYENLGFELKDFQELMAMLLEINDCVEE